MKNFVQSGSVLSVTAPADILSGAGVQVGKLFGVAATDALSGAVVQIQTEGVFSLAKLSTDDVAAGDLLYWDAGNDRLTKTAGTGSKLLAGVAVEAAGNGVATVKIKLGVHGIAGPAE